MIINWNEFATIAIIHLLAVASPGPDFAVVLRHSMHYGKAIALITSIGVGAGILVHVSYSILGISIVIATTPWLFDLIKYIAAGYLLFLAYGALTSKPIANKNSQEESENIAAISATKAFVVGFLTNGINPKATLFFLSLFTLILEPSSPLENKVFYGIYLAVATAIWFCGLSLLLNIGSISSKLEQCSIWIDRAMGLLLVVVAVNIIFFAHI